MSKELTKTTDDFNDGEKALLATIGCSGLTKDQFKLFHAVSKRTGLDPFTKQIYAIRRKGVMCLQVGIDGYRSVAAKSGQCVGISDATFAYKKTPSGQITHQIDSATVTVKRFVHGRVCEFTATAWWDEYYPGPGKEGYMWRQRPKGQLAKCAEALAIRKAFADMLSGTNTVEEMERADAIEEKDMEVLTRPTVDIDRRIEQVETIAKIAGEKCKGMSIQDKVNWMQKVIGVISFEDLKSKNNVELDKIIEKVTAWSPKTGKQAT